MFEFLQSKNSNLYENLLRKFSSPTFEIKNLKLKIPYPFLGAGFLLKGFLPPLKSLAPFLFIIFFFSS